MNKLTLHLFNFPNFIRPNTWRDPSKLLLKDRFKTDRQDTPAFIQGVQKVMNLS